MPLRILNDSLIAQSARHERTLEGMFWLVVVVLTGAVAIIVLSYIKKMRDAAMRRKVPPFTLDELRRFRDDGKITPAEYETLKAQLLCDSRV